MDIIGSHFEGEDTTRKELLLVIKNYKINLETLSKVTNIDKSWIKDYLDEKNNINDLSNDSMMNLSVLLSFLSFGISSVDDDERLKAIIEVLLENFKLEYETICLYSNIDINDLTSFMNDTNSISYEKKYKLAVKVMFLHYIFKTDEAHN